MYQDNTDFFGEDYPVEQPKMKNADMPAMPLVNEHGHPFHASSVAFDNHPLTSGLTKREMFAMAAMQGMLSHPEVMHTNDDEEHENIAHAVAANAVLMADALLSKLEQSK